MNKCPEDLQAALDGSLSVIDSLRTQLAEAQREVERLTQKYHQYRDIWLERGFLVKDEKPDLNSTVVGLNSKNLLLMDRCAQFEEALRRITLECRGQADTIARAALAEGQP